MGEQPFKTGFVFPRCTYHLHLLREQMLIRDLVKQYKGLYISLDVFPVQKYRGSRIVYVRLIMGSPQGPGKMHSDSFSNLRCVMFGLDFEFLNLKSLGSFYFF